MRSTWSIFACCVAFIGCSQTELEPEPTAFDPYDSSRGTRVAQLLQASPEGDLKIPAASSADQLRSAQARESKPQKSPESAVPVRTLIERWSQPDEPLQLTKLTSGQLGKRANRLSFTADGQLLYVGLYQEARHLLFQTADGKKVLDMQYGDAPLQSANITPDGKYLLATRGDQGVGVWNIAEQKEVFLHNRLVNAMAVQATQAESPMVAGALPDGTVCSYPLLGGKGKEWNWRKKNAAANADKTASVQMAAAADGQTLCIFDPCTPGNLHFAFADGRYCSAQVSTSAGGPMAAGKNIVVDTLTPGRFRLSAAAPGSTFLSNRIVKMNSWGARVLSVSPDDLYAANICLDKELFVIVSCRTGVRKSTHFPVGVRGYLGAVNWPTGSIVTADHDGGINLFRFSEHGSPADLLVQEVDRCLAEKEDDRLEQIAAELEQETTNFAFDGIDNTKYHRLVQTLMGGSDITSDPARSQQYQDWLERNPNSQLARICRATQLLGEAWTARGSGYADSVSLEGWRILEQKAAEAWKVLESLTDDDRMPGEAFALIFNVAQAQNWPEERIEPHVNRLFKDAPRNIRAHSERIQGLMPRWGGGPDDCREYAERVAAELGGAEGDAMYASLVVSLMNMADHGIAGQLGFDPVRFQAGLDHRFRDDLENPQYWQLAVMLAAIAGDEHRAHEFALKIAMRRDPYAGLYCNETIFDELLNSAQRFNPGRPVPKSNLQPLTPAL